MTTELVVHARIEIEGKAEGMEATIDAASALMPIKGSGRIWKAEVRIDVASRRHCLKRNKGRDRRVSGRA